jgi:hypothetical protein
MLFFPDFGQKYIYYFRINCLFSRKQGYLNRKIFTVNFLSPSVLSVNQTGQVFFIFLAQSERSNRNVREP